MNYYNLSHANFKRFQKVVISVKNVTLDYNVQCKTRQQTKFQLTGAMTVTL